MIKTWNQRCQEHPDHQTGMVSHHMIALRMQEEIDDLRAALAQPEQEPVAVVAMDVSGVHMSYGGQYLGQKPDTKIAMLLKDLPVGTHLYVAVGMGVSNE